MLQTLDLIPEGTLVKFDSKHKNHYFNQVNVSILKGRFILYSGKNSEPQK